MNSDFLRFIPSKGIYPYFSDINTQIKIILLQRVPFDGSVDHIDDDYRCKLFAMVIQQ